MLYMRGESWMKSDFWLRVIVSAGAVALLFSFPAAIAVKNRVTGAVAASTETHTGHTLIIDPGHGGEDGGAVSVTGTRESAINLAIAERSAALAAFMGEEPVMTRESEELDYPPEAATTRARKVFDQKRRAELINAAPDAVLISIHQNKYMSASPKGAQAFYRDGGEELAEKLRSGSFDLFILTNPSNPAGKLTELETVRMLAKTCEEAGTVMVVDECFMELTMEPESYSMTKAFLEYSNVLVLRAFTKTFAIPGIRLGYLLCKDETAARQIALQLPEWNVSLPAQAAGIAAMEQEGYLEASRLFIKTQRAFLEKGLQKLGGKVFQSDANFLLFQWKDEELYEKLLKQGYLIRDCRDYEGLGKGYYRIAVKNRMENEMLLHTMEAMVGGQKR